MIDTAHFVTAPTEAAPWWGVPVIAGSFLLTGAVIALLSTAASDRRNGSAALARIHSQVEMLEIIGTRTLVQRVADLVKACTDIVNRWHDRIDPGKDFYRALRAARGELLSTVKSEIRVERYQPALPVRLRTLRRIFRK